MNKYYKINQKYRKDPLELDSFLTNLSNADPANLIWCSTDVYNLFSLTSVVEENKTKQKSKTFTREVKLFFKNLELLEQIVNHERPQVHFSSTNDRDLFRQKTVPDRRRKIWTNWQKIRGFE